MKSARKYCLGFVLWAAAVGCSTKTVENTEELFPVAINLKDGAGKDLKPAPNEVFVLEISGPARANLEADPSGVYTLSAGRTGVPKGTYAVGINRVVNANTGAVAEPTGESIEVTPGKKDYMVAVKK